MNTPLVAYFSCGGITERLAKTLASVVGGSLYKIKPVIPYTADDLNWNDPASRSTVEMRDAASRPAIADTVNDMERYDAVFVGFPIWWYVAPTIINTFLEQYDFSGKVVVPFATSGSSGVGDTDKALRGSCSPETMWRPAKRFPPHAQADVLQKWVEGLTL
jgi:flavodoxin